jgi:hypothetical protein
MLKPIKFKQKIALCFSGIQYDIANPKKFIERFLNNYEVYCFVHTWEKEEILNSQKSGGYSMASIDFEEIKKIVSHIDIITEKFTDRFESFSRIYNSIYEEKKIIRKNLCLISMFYGIKQSQLLRKDFEIKNKISFDCVFRCRFENCWREDRRFFLPEYNLNNIWLPSTLKYPICDHLAFSNSSNMDYYGSIYDNIVNLANKIEYWPEKMLQEHLSIKKIEETNLFGSCGGYLWDS